MKKFLVLLPLLALQCFSFCQPVKKHGRLKVVGTQLMDEHDQPVVLRGMSFGWHNFWPRFYNEGAVKLLAKDWDCSVVRAAMGVEPSKGYIEDPTGSMRKIEAVVDGAIDAGIYVIIDFHSHNIRLKEAKKFFKEMAAKYGRYPNIIYELFNEPDYESWNEVKSYSVELIKTIRSIDSNNIILVGNPHWDQDINIVASDPISDFSNIMYTVHFYAATHKQTLRDRCDSALAKGIPIFISESAGMEASGDGVINHEKWQRWIDWCEQHNISWIIWSVSDKDETCSVLKPSASSNGHWKEKDLKESGIEAKALLCKYNQK